MPIRVVWDNEEKTIARMDFESSWGWVEFREAQQILKGLRAAVTYGVPVILNLQNAQPMPLEGAVTNLKHSAQHDLTDNMVFVSIKPVAKELIRIFSEIQPEIRAKVFFAASLEEARKLLADINKPRFTV